MDFSTVSLGSQKKSPATMSEQRYETPGQMSVKNEEIIHALTASDIDKMD